MRLRPNAASALTEEPPDTGVDWGKLGRPLTLNPSLGFFSKVCDVCAATARAKIFMTTRVIKSRESRPQILIIHEKGHSGGNYLYSVGVPPARRRQKYTDQMKTYLKIQLSLSPDLIRLPVDTGGFH